MIHQKYRFEANLPESDSRHYAKRVYTHTENRRGRKVRYYDCYRINPDYVPPVFTESERVNKEKVRSIERFLGIRFRR